GVGADDDEEEDEPDDDGDVADDPAAATDAELGVAVGLARVGLTRIAVARGRQLRAHRAVSSFLVGVGAVGPDGSPAVGAVGSVGAPGASVRFGFVGPRRFLVAMIAEAAASTANASRAMTLSTPPHCRAQSSPMPSPMPMRRISPKCSSTAGR